MALIHGGDTEGFYMEYGYEPLDFSSNCNPLGPPEGVKRSICLSAEKIDSYPDPLCRRLCAAIAEYEGVLPQSVLCGSGSADLIDRLAYAGRPGKTIVTAPTFSEYERAVRNAGGEIIYHPLCEEEGYAVKDDILNRLTPDVDMLFLCNPNNPTGLTIESNLLNRILDACIRADILLVVDECFNGFLDQPGEHTLKFRLIDSRNLFILKAFTKIYGMAGVRLGYCLSTNGELLDAMRSAGQPWAVSSLAQAAGLAALRENIYIDETRQLIRSERAYLANALEALGMNVSKSEANYIFFRSDIPGLTDRLRSMGILIRDCSGYNGLLAGSYRVAVRTHEENVRLVDSLSACLNET